MDRIGGWIQTYSGKQFWPLDPRPDEIEINDIAHALGMMCRFAGHVERFYSVAEHSLLLSLNAPDEFKLWALLHDATEAYLVDIPRPIKPYLTNYVDIENYLMKAIAEKFGLGSTIIPSAVKAMDHRILLDEQIQNMKPQVVAWDPIPGGELGVKLLYLEPREAETRFLDQFHKLTENKFL